MKIFNTDLLTFSKIREGYQIAEKILLDDEFTRILALQNFTYTKDKGFMVALSLRDSVARIKANQALAINIEEYYYKNSNVIGMTKGGSTIFVNRNGINSKPLKTFIGNALHEFGHHPMGYSHGSNFPPGSWKGRLLGDFANKNLSVSHTLDRLGLAFAKTKGYL